VGNLSLTKMACAVFVFCVVIAISLHATTTFTSLLSFDGTNGTDPDAGLVQGFNGNFYGTTYYGGAMDYGTVFEITPGGTLTTLHSFENSDGASPNAGLVQATNGNLYGTTVYGGSDKCPSGCGTVFEITAASKLTTLFSFDSTDGAHPYAGLVQATNGNLYGTTVDGGAHGEGTVFEITAAGRLTTLFSFESTDGAFPYAGLVQATNGNLYGTTTYGGANNYGTVFEITPAGKLTTLFSFDSTNGAYPYAGLVQAMTPSSPTNGNFYGTTYEGGAKGDGTVFEITAAGKLTTLFSFDSTDGAHPYAALVQATNGNFYGAAYQGGAKGEGTVFEITAAGKLTTLFSFDSTDGAYPYAGLVQATNGNFYGATLQGGATSDGTVFSLSVGLGPFVETLPAFGIEKATIIILGTNLTGATKVTFGGTEATFSVVSSSEIKAAVPSGAKTGTVEVTTPKGTLQSNLIFQVTPQLTSFTPTSGVVGTSVKITGTELTDTTQVTFGGVKATDFTPVSDSEVTADVPTGAKTGKIAITTPGGTSTSAASFTVTP